jgi:F-type H+-transporting ATPase subunit b
MKRRMITLILLSLPIILLVAGVAHASEEGASPWTMSKQIWRVINSIALVALLVYFLKKPWVNFFSERKANIERDLQEAKEQRARAEALIQEYRRKIADMEKELDKMRAELSKSAEAEREKVLVNAERMAASIIEAARMTADQEVRKAKTTLKNDAVGLAMEMAEQLIRDKITDADRQKMTEDYLVKVGGMK